MMLSGQKRSADSGEGSQGMTLCSGVKAHRRGLDRQHPVYKVDSSHLAGCPGWAETRSLQGTLTQTPQSQCPPSLDEPSLAASSGALPWLGGGGWAMPTALGPLFSVCFPDGHQPFPSRSSVTPKASHMKSSFHWCLSLLQLI